MRKLLVTARTSGLRCLGLLALAGLCTDASADSPRSQVATGVDEHGLVAGLHLVSGTSDAFTIVQPTPVRTVLGMMWGMWPYTVNYTMVLRPAVCRRALENEAGAFYLCEGRSEYVEARVPPGWIRAVRNQAIVWRSADNARAVLFGYEVRKPDLDAAALLALLQDKMSHFNYVAIASDAWNASVTAGVKDISVFAGIDKASTAAFGPHDRDANSKPLDVPPASIDRASGIVWGDSRGEEQVRIERVDATGYGSFNGYAPFAVVPAGAHALRLNYYRPGKDDYAFESDLQVAIEAGKAYVVAFDVEDKPYIEDLGAGTYCEIRRYKQFGMAAPANSWLACKRQAPAPNP